MKRILTFLILVGVTIFAGRSADARNFQRGGEVTILSSNDTTNVPDAYSGASVRPGRDTVIYVYDQTPAEGQKRGL